MPGILTEISSIIAAYNINIQQVIVNDFELTVEPRLIIITEKAILESLIPIIQQTVGIKAVLIY